jgi:hypothetical protein
LIRALLRSATALFDDYFRTRNNVRDASFLFHLASSFKKNGGEKNFRINSFSDQLVFSLSFTRPEFPVEPVSPRSASAEAAAASRVRTPCSEVCSWGPMLKKLRPKFIFIKATTLIPWRDSIS